MSVLDYENWTRDEVAEWPEAAVTFERTAKHRKAVLWLNDATRFVIYPSTPGDNYRAIYNHIADVRRELVALGAVRNERIKSTRPRSERNPGADLREMPAGEMPEARPDPWEALRELAARPLEAGLHALTSAAYHADPAPEPSLSATLAKLIVAKSPRHAWHASPRLNPEWEAVNKATFDIGRAAHRAVLGRGDDYVAIPEDILAKDGGASTKAAKEFIADTRAAGQTPLKADVVAQIAAMRDVAHARLATHGITLDPARSELAALAQIDGVWCRAMFDHVPADPSQPIYDYKSCEDASPAACQRAIGTYGYDIQAEHYRAVWRAAMNENRRFVFIFQEKAAPHEVTLVALSGSYQDVGQQRAGKARRLWAECITTNNWPGYPIGTHEVDAPAWAIERAYEEQF